MNPAESFQQLRQGIKLGTIWHNVFLSFDRFVQDRLLAIVAGLQEGIEDLRAGRVFHPKQEVRNHQRDSLWLSRAALNPESIQNLFNVKDV